VYKRVVYFVSIIFASAFETGINAAAESKTLPEVIERESARSRVVLNFETTYHVPNFAASKSIEAEKTSKGFQSANQKEERAMVGRGSDIEVRGILEQVGKEKESLPGVLSGGNSGGMPPVQQMYQPEIP